MNATITSSTKVSSEKITELYQESMRNLYGDANRVAATEDAINEVAARWLSGDLPSQITTEKIGIFWKKAVDFETGKRFRDISSHGLCKGAPVDGYTPCQRGKAVIEIEKAFRGCLKGRQLDVALMYFIEGKIQKEISLDLGVKPQAVSAMIKRIGDKASTPGTKEKPNPLYDKLFTFIVGSIDSNYPGSENELINMLDSGISFEPPVPVSAPAAPAQTDQKALLRRKAQKAKRHAVKYSKVEAADLMRKRAVSKEIKDCKPVINAEKQGKIRLAIAKAYKPKYDTATKIERLRALQAASIRLAKRPKSAFSIRLVRPDKVRLPAITAHYSRCSQYWATKF